jgi:hypothetical protein
MDVAPEKDDLFNEDYDEEHVPAVLQVPGVLAAARFKTEELTMMLGGERRTIVVEGEPKYSALYELESPEVMVSKEWAEATELGRWPGEVRPYTGNRRLVLRRRIDSGR